MLLHKGRPIYDSAEQIQYIDKYLTGPSNSLIPPAHADEVREWVNFTSVDCVHDFNELDTHQRMGCCVPGCTLPMFAALLRETRLSNIAWGIGKHPVKIRPPIMCLLKLIGPYLIIILPKMRRVVQDARDAMRVHLQGIDDLLSDGRPYLVGDTFTLADVSLMVVFERLDVGGFADTLYSDLNHVVRYWDRMKQRPSYGTAIKEQELPRVVRATAQVEKWKRDRRGGRRISSRQRRAEESARRYWRAAAAAEWAEDGLPRLGEGIGVRGGAREALRYAEVLEYRLRGRGSDYDIK